MEVGVISATSLQIVRFLSDLGFGDNFGVRHDQSVLSIRENNSIEGSGLIKSTHGNGVQ